jgi:hypothetical protein
MSNVPWKKLAGSSEVRMSEQRYAVLIASSQFPDEAQLRQLRCPERDVDGLNEILTSPVYGAFTETVVLKNIPHYEALRKMNQALKRAGARDLVLLYYSGHGKLDLAGRLHLATVDTTIAELETTSIPVESIRRLVDVSASTQVVLILDCCFSGAAGPAWTRSGVDDQLQLASGGRGIYLLTASTGIQVALEKEQDQYGVFTKHVIEGIRSGHADLDGDGQVTMDELYRYVHDQVLAEGFQEPMKWNLNVRGEVVIARSGKIPHEERRQQIRQRLFELAAQGILPDPVVSKALDVLTMKPTQLVGELRRYDELLDSLVRERVRVGDFIYMWHQVEATSRQRESQVSLDQHHTEEVQSKQEEPQIVFRLTGFIKKLIFSTISSRIFGVLLISIIVIIVAIRLFIFYSSSHPPIHPPGSAPSQSAEPARRKM